MVKRKERDIKKIIKISCDIQVENLEEGQKINKII
jgi:hypothetical protein